MKQTTKIAAGIYRHLTTGIEIWWEPYASDDNSPWKLAGHTDHAIYKEDYLHASSFNTKAQAIQYINAVLEQYNEDKAAR